MTHKTTMTPAIVNAPNKEMRLIQGFRCGVMIISIRIRNGEHARGMIASVRFA